MTTNTNTSTNVSIVTYRLNTNVKTLPILKRVQELMELKSLPPIIVRAIRSQAVPGAYYQHPTDESLDEILINPSRFWYIRDHFEFSWIKNMFWGVVVHELRHYKQYREGWCKRTSYKDGTVLRYIWKGEEHWVEEDDDKSQMQYISSPWELDANIESERIVDILLKENLISIDEEYIKTRDLWGVMNKRNRLLRAKHYWKRMWAT